MEEFNGLLQSYRKYNHQTRGKWERSVKNFKI